MSNVNDTGTMNSPDIMVDTLPSNFETDILNQAHPLANMLSQVNSDQWDPEPLIEADYIDGIVEPEIEENSLANDLFSGVVEPEIEVVDIPEAKVTDIVPYQKSELESNTESNLGTFDQVYAEEILITNPNPVSETKSVLEPEVIFEGEFIEIDEGDDDSLLSTESSQPFPEGEREQVNSTAEENTDTSNINTKISHINNLIGEKIIPPTDTHISDQQVLKPTKAKAEPINSRVEVKKITKTQYETVNSEFEDLPEEVEPVVEILERNKKYDKATEIRIKHGKIRDAGSSDSKPLELQPEKVKHDKNNSDLDSEQVDEQEESVLVDMLEYLMDLVGSPDFDPSTLRPDQFEIISKANPEVLQKVVKEEDDENLFIEEELPDLNTNILAQDNNTLSGELTPEAQAQMNTLRFFVNAMHRNIREQYTKTGNLDYAVNVNYAQTLEILGNNLQNLPAEFAYAVVINGEVLPIIKGQSKIITYEHEGEMLFLQGIPGKTITTVHDFQHIPKLQEGTRLAILDVYNLNLDGFNTVISHLKRNINSLNVDKPIEIEVEINGEFIPVTLRVIEDPEKGKILLPQFRQNDLAKLEG